MAHAAVTLKRLSLELGGKTPMIVFDDADLDVVVPVLTKAVTTFSGQFCMTGSRVLAQAGIAGQLRERLSKSLGAVNGGPGIDLVPRHRPAAAGRTAAARRHGVDQHLGPRRRPVRGRRLRTERPWPAQRPAWTGGISGVQDLRADRRVIRCFRTDQPPSKGRA